jgi:polar amino acid transport system ATP-binding protein
LDQSIPAGACERIHSRMTMRIATHEMGFAREVADEVCFLHDGAILERGAPADVLGAPQRPETQRFLHRLLDAGRL